MLWTVVALPAEVKRCSSTTWMMELSFLFLSFLFFFFPWQLPPDKVEPWSTVFTFVCPLRVTQNEKRTQLRPFLRVRETVRKRRCLFWAPYSHRLFYARQQSQQFSNCCEWLLVGLVCVQAPPPLFGDTLIAVGNEDTKSNTNYSKTSRLASTLAPILTHKLPTDPFHISCHSAVRVVLLGARTALATLFASTNG